jgi:hypothetical protein
MDRWNRYLAHQIIQEECRIRHQERSLQPEQDQASTSALDYDDDTAQSSRVVEQVLQGWPLSDSGAMMDYDDDDLDDDNTQSPYRPNHHSEELHYLAQTIASFSTTLFHHLCRRCAWYGFGLSTFVREDPVIVNRPGTTSDQPHPDKKNIVYHLKTQRIQKLLYHHRRRRRRRRRCVSSSRTRRTANSLHLINLPSTNSRTTAGDPEVLINQVSDIDENEEDDDKAKVEEVETSRQPNYHGDDAICSHLGTCSSRTRSISPRSLSDMECGRLNIDDDNDCDEVHDDEDCVICLTSICTNTNGGAMFNDENDDRVCDLECGHLFHLDCIKRWMVVRRNNECPLCRGPMARVVAGPVDDEQV